MGGQSILAMQIKIWKNFLVENVEMAVLCVVSQSQHIFKMTHLSIFYLDTADSFPPVVVFLFAAAACCCCSFASSVSTHANLLRQMATYSQPGSAGGVILNTVSWCCSLGLFTFLGLLWPLSLNMI